MDSNILYSFICTETGSFLNNTIFQGAISGLIVVLIVWLADRILIFLNPPKVLVHKAYFQGNTNEYYFVKVINHSILRSYTITHVWIEDNKRETHILAEPLPVKIQPTEIWETYIKKEEVLDQINIYKNIRVKTTSRRVLRSKENKKVPEKGYVSISNPSITGTTFQAQASDYFNTSP